ncbi:ESX-1 secretion-associated protein EspK-like isoform X8 [Pieris napi]|uniref:ESX-1 secretion-associated protein EspK-like isoform X8 n=1 Tax=Pieris napi TaxID=78633 RepID=UPI001FBB0D21|nr:ESX-1 secretion-associated protein EspK-like isoform X8 [Pieris napi]
MAKMISTFTLFVLSILHAHAAPQGATIPQNNYNLPPDVPQTSYSPTAAPANVYSGNTPKTTPFYPGFKNPNYPVHPIPNNPVPIVPLTQPVKPVPVQLPIIQRVPIASPLPLPQLIVPNVLIPINTAQATTYTSNASGNAHATSVSRRIFRRSCSGLGSCSGVRSCLGSGSCSGMGSGKGSGSCLGQGSCSGAGSGSGTESCSGAGSCSGSGSGKRPGSCSEPGSCSGAG